MPNMLTDYPVLCHAPGCTRLANYKIAAQWSDGTTHELKTYSLSCAECLATLYPLARQKQKSCRSTVGETLGKPGIYERRNVHDPRNLVHRADLETA